MSSSTPDFGGVPAPSDESTTTFDDAGATVGDNAPSGKVDTGPDESVDPDEVKKDELVEEAESRGLSTSGTKNELAERINDDVSGRVYKPEVQTPRTKD